jgi:signal peptidase II
MSEKWRWLAAAFLPVVILDQVTKAWARTLAAYREEVHIIPQFLSFMHAKNTGAAFSSLDEWEYRMHAFAVFTVVALVVLAFTFKGLKPSARVEAAVVGMILGGAVGNAVDRAIFGSVTDWIKVYVGAPASAKAWLVERFHTNVWPIFNIADSAILVGVAWFGLFLLFQKDNPAEGGAPDPV